MEVKQDASAKTSDRLVWLSPELSIEIVNVGKKKWDDEKLHLDETGR